MRIAEFKKLINQIVIGIGGNVQSNGLSKNMFDICDSNGNIVKTYYVKISSSKVGFWGLTVNQINKLNNNNVPFSVVLISNDYIHILNDNVVNKDIHNNSNFPVAKDNEYKINAVKLKNTESIKNVTGVISICKLF
ncbi:hypothetical protein ACFIJ5_07445 [Haloimpatiens sp. FM7330]|uniref:hypothetical protein n=1 Tax=Haloimpatiens sp. FM7330 TaxID=3298610 RepID=UPI0036390253